jgi:ribosomal protein L34E
MSVAAKLVQVMKAVTSLEKDGRNTMQNYNYLSEENITTSLHKAFAEAGLAIIPTSMAVVDSREITTSKGNVMYCPIIAATYDLVDPDDGDRVQMQVLGEGSDSGDKAINKCMTAAYKYALRQTCMISTGDDPDHVPSEEATQTKKQAPKSSPKSNGAPVCEDCGNAIEGYKSKAGKEYTPADMVKFSQKDYGKSLCKSCSFKAKEAKENPDAAQDEQQNPNLATPAQISRVHAMAGEAYGTKPEGVAKFKKLKEQILGESKASNDMTVREISDVMDALQVLIDEAKAA